MKASPPTRQTPWQQSKPWLLALLPLALLVAGVFWGLHWMLARPVGQVAIYGEITYADQMALQERALPWLNEPFWRVDLEGMQQSLVTDPWLAAVEITRRWPNQIDIHLYEHQAWAFWQDRGVLNASGELFFPQNRELLELDLHFYASREDLPSLLVFYEQLQSKLDKLNLKITEIQLEPRGAWRLQLEEGVILHLGRDNIEKRINRFLWAWQKWSASERELIHVIDARYPNGLSVAWKRPTD